MPPPRSILLVTDWFDLRFHQGVARFAREHGWRLSLESAYGRALPWGWRGDGVVAIISSEETAQFVRSLKVPVVDASQSWSKLRLPRVHEDDAAIGRMGAEFFLERGFRQLAYCSPDDNPVHRVRRDGFRQAAKAGGAALVELVLRDKTSGDKTWQAIRDDAAKKLRALDRPTGLLCVDDCSAALVCDIAKEEGVDIPGRLAILGVGNLETACECSWVPLSSIQLQTEQSGHEAARMLEEILSGKHGRWPQKSPPTRMLAPVGIIERASTQGVAAQDERLARVVQHMYAHPVEEAPVESLAAIARVGNRKLYELFAEEFQSTPAAFFEQVRLRAACRLLADPARKMRVVAKEAGFGTTLRLHRAFMRCVGMPPGRWRKLEARGKAPKVAVLPGR